MGFVLIQNEQRVLHDMGIAIMIFLADTFGLKPEVIRITWHQESGKWMPEVGLPKIPNATEEEIREIVMTMYRQARHDLAIKFKQNRTTRFHGP